MQVGTSNIYFDLQVGKYNNFLKYDDLIVFRLTEVAGCALPIVLCMFRTTSTFIKDSVVENNPVTIKIGESASNADTFKAFVIAKDVNSDQANTGFTVFFSACIGNPRFLIDQINKSYRGNSLQVAKEIVKDYFKKDLQSDVYTVREQQQNWLRCNQSANTYLQDTILHMNLGEDDVPLMGIDRYGNAYLKTLQSIKKAGVKYKLVPYKSASPNEIQYINNFQVNSNRNTFNIFAGFGRYIKVSNLDSAKIDILMGSEDPLVTSSTITDVLREGNTPIDNISINGNVSDSFQKTIFRNTEKIMQLSILAGDVQLIPKYHRNVKLLDLVDIVIDGTNTSGTADVATAGLYLVEMVDISFGSGTPFTMFLGLCRDGYNNKENVLANTTPKFNVSNTRKKSLLSTVGNMRRVLARLRLFVSGQASRNIFNFIVNTKYNALNSFSIANTPLNFNSQQLALRSSLNVANSIMNSLVNEIIPSPFNLPFRDLLLRAPQLLTTLSGLFMQYATNTEMGRLLQEFLYLMNDTTSTMQQIEQSNIVSHDTYYSYIASNNTSSLITFKDSISGVSDIKEGKPMNDTTTQKVDDIVNIFEDNTAGSDIPFPVVNLTESESLLSNKELEDLIADRVIEELTNAGYLEGIDNFKDILLGKEPMDFNTIDKINQNVGIVTYARHWGVYKDPVELTDFYIAKSFKDVFKTIGTTKLINATGGKKIFFACPTKEENLKFYVNNTRIDLESMPIDLHYVDVFKQPIPYTVYFTETGFNSNSVIFEVRK